MQQASLYKKHKMGLLISKIMHELKKKEDNLLGF